ncbi:cytochrome c oxidase assembly factor 8 [Synchiropus splendidus]|uniref:cytochrome c oxidase assembly factor 8 n=1 Tax=Synchiropus splendidus TaxID=270530 RepID=UPI00237DFAD1|nr:cytochrome c oxidase assembly factor 8 [Synchiropus splendidus]
MVSVAAGCFRRSLICPLAYQTPWCAHIRRCSSSNSAPQHDKKQKRSRVKPAASPTHDWIGPPNQLSNLRPIIYRTPENETELEKRLRHLRQETEDWNHTFWAKQNITFSKEKQAFIISQLQSKGLSLRDEQGHRRALSSEEMASFYKAFLDKNRTRHANYNKEWYRRNLTITFLMARVSLWNMWKRLANKYNTRNNTPTA